MFYPLADKRDHRARGKTAGVKALYPYILTFLVLLFGKIHFLNLRVLMRLPKRKMKSTEALAVT